MNWTRVTRHTRCPICDHDSWCEFTPDGKRVLCMRVESQHQAKSGGWMHNLSGGLTAVQPLTVKARSIADAAQPLINAERMLANWRYSQNGQLEPFAATLGVSQASLRALDCVWAPEHRAFAFPMRDGQGRVIGIRLRNDRGEKWAVKGSKQGLFLNLSGGVESRHAARLISQDRKGALRKAGSGEPATSSPVGGYVTVTASPADLQKPHHRGSSAPPAQNNLPAASVLTVPETCEVERPLPAGGEARESTSGELTALMQDSRDGRQNTLSGGVKLPCKHGTTESKDGLNSAIVQSDNARSPAQPLLIVEGPTDAAAAIDLGFTVIGRPACLGCEDMIAEAAKGWPGLPLIIADADAPGQRGALKLQEKLRHARIVTLPCKDLRQFKNLGGTKLILNEIIASQL